ncbi:hypothetical protein D3C81_966750 [compost metagenome]
MNAIAAGWRTHVKHRITYTLSDTALDFVMINQSHAHCVDQRIAVIALIKHDFSADRRNPDAVPVPRDPGHHMLKQILHPVAFQLAESE